MTSQFTLAFAHRGMAVQRLRPLALSISLLLLSGGDGTASAADFPATLNLSSLSGGDGFRLDGVAAGDGAGRSVSSAGDINGDGIDDLIVGAAFASSNGQETGSSYVVFGQSNAFAAAIALSSLDGSNGFQIDGEGSTDRFGRSLSAAGDLNGDGYDDLVIGASGAGSTASGSTNRTGRSYVVFGRSTPFPANLPLDSLDGTMGFRIDGASGGHGSGWVVSGAGDVNGDGLDDLIIGTYHAEYSDPTGTWGSCYVVFGSPSPRAGVLSLSSLDGSNGFRVDGEPNQFGFFEYFGRSVSAAGDVNGDGLADLVMGAPGADPNGYGSGSSYVVFGQSTPYNPTLGVSALDGSNGFRLDGERPSAFTGSSVHGAGDVNGDGFDDVVVGNSPNSFGPDPTYIVYGSSAPFAATLALSSLDGNNGFRIGSTPGTSAYSFGSAGDINGDGLGDLIVASHFAQPNGINSGSSYVIYGQRLQSDPVLDLTSLDGSNGFRLDGSNGERSGSAVSAAGDINADGVDDLIVGAYSAGVSGAAYVVFGRYQVFRDGFE